MRRYEKRTRAVITNFQVELTCDLCKKTAPGADWTREMYEVNEASVKWMRGYSYPGDYNVETTRFDICPDCFKDRLMPWLATQGAEPTVSDKTLP